MQIRIILNKVPIESHYLIRIVLNNKSIESLLKNPLKISLKKDFDSILQLTVKWNSINNRSS